ncbi:adhesion G protein-coupled receptor G3-like [Engraulis encrasicolus]|uniref:adhesion G protein-coupled receptor G3-like n=1 Tax=Engraulis encrasicolus TaxID=184585 RepID=UPI002FD11405
MEVPKQVLSEQQNRSGEQLNIGASWFIHDVLFPVDDLNVTLLSPRVVSLNLGQEVSGLQEPINITFIMDQPINNSIYLESIAKNVSIKPQCVFWDVQSSTSAVWNSSGCETLVEGERVICSCDHLSVFAVLLTPVGVTDPLSAVELFTLTVLSRVGCSISLAFLLLTLITHAVYQKGPSENSLWIHLQVCVSLLLLNLSFLLNDFLSGQPIVALCVAMAALTHYCLLSMLTWLAIEGLHLYLLFIRVFNIHIRRYLLKLALLGWGLPVIPVAIGVGLEKYGVLELPDTEDGGTQLCWVKPSDLVLSILTYVYFLLVMLFNITMFSVVLNKVLKARPKSPLPQDRGLNRGMVLSLLALSWILGLSWAVMALSAVPTIQKITLYIFCTCNGMHGFFLFLRYATLLRKEKENSSSHTTSTNPHTSNKT